MEVIMRFFLTVIILLGSLAVPSAAAPVVGGIQNNYSYLIEGSPNHAIAQGAIFILYGSGMAGPGLVQGGFNPALDPQLGGVVIRVTVNGVTTQAIPYYVSPTQLAAILPSATPVGDGTLTVAFGGQTSAPYPIHVAAGAFGFMTMGGNGLGQAVVMNAGFELLSPGKAVQEDQVVIFWGSGLGAFEGDETRLIAAPRNLDAAPFELYVGGRLAETIYHGRSQFPGLDQVVARIPRGSTGCFVSLYAKTGAVISNFTTIPIAAAGQTACDEPFVGSEELTGLLAQPEVSAGWFYLGRFTHHSRNAQGAPSQLIQDAASAQFIRYTSFDYANWGAIGQTSFGSCVVSTYVLTQPFTPRTIGFIDPGPVSLRMPDGTSRPMLRNPNPQALNYTLSGLTSDPNLPLFLGEPGQTHTFTGPGMAPVGPIDIPITRAPVFRTGELPTLTEIPRDRDFTITWTGGATDSYVVVIGFSHDLERVMTGLVCTERVEAGRITIPRDILASMVQSKIVFAGPPLSTTGQILVYNYGLPTRFDIPGIDNVNAAFYEADTAVVVYK